MASHSFDKTLIRTRPNLSDKQDIDAFAKALVRNHCNSCLPSENALDLASLGLGQRPYRPYLQPLDEMGQPMDFKSIRPAVDHAKCNRCGACVAACPLGSIPVEAPETTPGKCSKCNACVQVCPMSARIFVDLGYLWHLKELRSTCSEDALNLWTVGLAFKPLALREDVSRYCDFVKAQYRDDPHFRDYITPVISEFYSGKSEFSKNCDLQGFWIQEPKGDQPLGAVSFLVHKSYPSVLQVVFMEYANRLDVAYALLAAAMRRAKALGLRRVTFGLNGHVNYGLGLSTTQSHVATFGAPYSKTIYPVHLDHLAKDYPQLIKKTITSYEYEWSQGGFPMTEGQMSRLQNRSGGKLTYRNAKVHGRDFSKEDMAIYTQLNNGCFTRHDFYFPRQAKEDLELFKDLRHFMVEGSLIFAYYEDLPVGFLLWYPDWSQWMAPGETLGIKTYLIMIATRLFKKPQAFKIVEWAVLPEHSKKGVPLILLKACENQIKPYHFKKMYTSWIMDENLNSNTFAKHWASPSEHYAAYRMDMD